MPSRSKRYGTASHLNPSSPFFSQKLDYLKTLGVDCIWLLPFYKSPLKDDGYDISDYYSIQPEYGTMDDFQRFLDDAHASGIRVIADLVLNHVSDQNQWFQEAKKDRNSPEETMWW